MRCIRSVVAIRRGKYICPRLNLFTPAKLTQADFISIKKRARGLFYMAWTVGLHQQTAFCPQKAMLVGIIPYNFIAISDTVFHLV